MLRRLTSFLVVAVCFVASAQQKKGPATPPLLLTTSAFTDGDVIPNKYTQNDPNPVSPKLEWSQVSPRAVTLVLWMHDADTALQSNPNEVLHWMAFNIPASSTGLPENVANTATLPDGTVQLKNQRGVPGFLGPGAPAGPYHHYIFELFALDTKLDLTADATRVDVMKAMEGHVVGKAALVGRFHR